MRMVAEPEFVSKSGQENDAQPSWALCGHFQGMFKGLLSRICYRTPAHSSHLAELYAPPEFPIL